MNCFANDAFAQKKTVIQRKLQNTVRLDIGDHFRYNVLTDKKCDLPFSVLDVYYYHSSLPNSIPILNAE